MKTSYKLEHQNSVKYHTFRNIGSKIQKPKLSVDFIS